MIADLLLVALFAGCASARPRSSPARLSPPNAPIWRKLRRVMPSQKRCLAPQSVNIAYPPWNVMSQPVGQARQDQPLNGNLPNRVRQFKKQSNPKGTGTRVQTTLF